MDGGIQFGSVTFLLLHPQGGYIIKVLVGFTRE